MWRSLSVQGKGSAHAAQQDRLSHNWPLLIFVAIIPLQNIYLGKLPTFSGGINFVNLMALGALLLWRNNPVRSMPSPTDLHYPVYGFIAIYVVSALHGIYVMGHVPPRYFSSLKDIFLPLLIFFIVLNSVRDRRGIVAVVVATLLPLAYMFRVFYVQFSNVYSWHYSDDLRFVNGTFMTLGSNELAAFYASYTFVILMLSWYLKSWRYRLVLTLLALLNLYSLMYSQSRGAWLAFLVAFSVVLFKLGKAKWLLVVVVLALASPVIVKFFPVSVQERFSTIFAEEEERDKSAQSRFIIWENAIDAYAEHPFLGVGYRIFNTLNDYENKDTHNYYLKLLVEQGPLGLIIFLMILWRSYRNGQALWKESADPLFKALGLGMAAVVVSLAVGNLFGDRFTHYPLSTYFWVYLALVLRARMILQAEKGGQDRVGKSARPRVLRYGRKQGEEKWAS